MKRKNVTYAQAIGRLEQIVGQIENNQLGIDALCDALKEANEIITFCSEKLTKVDQEVEKIWQEKKELEE